jgi:dTDP-4-dehydrorhamnose 3,5-epimerase
MIEGVIVKKLQKYDDARGWLAEIWRSDEIDYRPTMAYASQTKPGTVRGPHEHVKQSDYFVFFGPGTFELHLWDRRENSTTYKEYFKEEFGENSPAIVIVPPGVVHGYKNISSADALSINLADKLWRGEGKKEEVDEIRWETDPSSPYKIV